ncbi:hypothetical protein TVAG_006570 [Trichomonas vaginalis G3]|uniref:ABC transporter domain-containing protein n=1 Tax=Trichomonas vaginalis (strain ATCC PRA-98 / G3) TaxID=412133 RepID=A2FTD8_TRIV3|nr:ATPase activity, coupled to transmembrane movement of substances [Trichomonas vaginalis G3]EAX91823.1 hypothetical protein TVAG_006570 [Trichomonas vaginalis G3]KAI5520243.1 ATPase activity, coupled to transmembrane movement of substances [Trichomonas vaginalis G3]|eukprot:XP_001304753.1 hypothetical protein [Trichomonas vaginalis G3]
MSSLKAQVIGVLYRRIIIYWNSKLSLIAIFLFSILFASSACIIPSIVSSANILDEERNLQISNFEPNDLTFARISNKNCSLCDTIQMNLSNKFSFLIKEQFNTTLKFLDFESFEKFEIYLQSIVKNPQKYLNIPAAFQIVNDSKIYPLNGRPNGNFELKMVLNRTIGLETEEFFNRALLEMVFDEYENKGNITAKFYYTGFREYLESNNPRARYEYWIMLTTPIAVIIFSVYLLNHTIQDIKTNAHSYMISCGLSKLTYWIGNFLIDSILLLIFSISIYILYISFGVTSFRTYYIQTFFLNILCNLSTIFYTYVWAFILNKPYGSNIFAIVNILMALICFFVRTYLKEDIILLYHVIASTICPFINWIETMCGFVLAIIEYQDSPPNHEIFKGREILFLTFIISFTLYPSIIYFIEKIWKRINNVSKDFYLSHMNDFQTIKESMLITEEVLEMEKDVLLNEDNYSIRILDVCKIFKDNEKKPIYAVNQVSLGIKNNSVFGFLGANGAGKTTLIKMIL